MEKDKGTTPLFCRLCNAKMAHANVVGDYVYGGSPKHKFYKCDNCDVAFLYPPMTESDEKIFYAKEFEKFMEKRAGRDFDWSGPEAHIKSNEKQFKRRLKFFSDLVIAGNSFLEIGCSSGFMLLPLKEMGLDVVGIEPSKVFSNFLKAHGIEVYDSLDSLSPIHISKKFDLVSHFFVLEHMREPVNFLKKSLDLVKEGGHMIFEVPNYSDPLISIYNIPAFQKFYWSIAHNYYFNRQSLEYVLKKVASKYQIMPEQRYDLSNHITWAQEGRPGGQGRYSSFFTSELENAYLNSMKATGHCDTFMVRIEKGDK